MTIRTSYLSLRGRGLFKTFSLAVLALMLAACAAVQPQSDTTPGRNDESIALNGRLSVRYQAYGREEALHGSFAWLQHGERTDLTLLSPLGQTIAKINVEPGMASLTQAGQPTRTATDIDSLVENTLGWPLPVKGLRDWLQGRATADNGALFLASEAHPEVTTRDGWKLKYLAWEGGTSPLPKRLDLERQTLHAGLVAIRIVIDDRSRR